MNCEVRETVCEKTQGKNIPGGGTSMNDSKVLVQVGNEVGE